MKRENWIDNMKGIAVLAVVFDHAFYIFYKLQYPYIWQQTFFSIPWFVFLVAVTNTLSSNKKKWIFPRTFLTFWFARIKNILLPYIFASVLIYIISHRGVFQLTEILNELVNFSAQPTYYFINLLFQLYFVFPFLYTLVVRIKIKWLFLPLVFLIFFVSFRLFIMSDHLPWPFYSLGAIFGGRYFFIFFLGILYGKKLFRESKHMYLFFIIIFLIYEFIINTSKIFLLRPVSVNLMIWSLALFFIIKKWIEIFPRKKILTYTLAILGKYSLFIYLFHYFLLEKISQLLLVTDPILFLGMVGLVVLISYGIGYIYNLTKYAIISTKL